MTEGVLVLNSGSSSIKFRVFALKGRELTLHSRGLLENLTTKPVFNVQNESGIKLSSQNLALKEGEGGHTAGLKALLGWLDESDDTPQIVAAGHRVVHGGRDFFSPTFVDEGVLEKLESFTSLAPLHQPHCLAPIRLLEKLNPGLPQVACFDTAFHRTQPDINRMFALPREYWEEGVERYGFHGLSYDYINWVLPDYMENSGGRNVIAHLGNGASMCALHNRKSVATTMGFTALEGLPMGTRCGHIDPGVLLYMQQVKGLSVDEVAQVLYYESGLLGLSGISNDMRELLSSDAVEAKQAVDLYCSRINRELGSLSAALGGLDALIFTGGVGENAEQVRAKVCELAGWLGIVLDETANSQNATKISAAHSRVSVWVIPTDEERVIAEETLTLI